jgi:hypothetical protein
MRDSTAARQNAVQVRSSTFWWASGRASSGGGKRIASRFLTQLNGLANRSDGDANTNADNGLRHTGDDFPTALPTDNGQIDPRFAEIETAWMTLSEADREDVSVFVHSLATTGRGG